jgi:type IV secretory pathway VirB10-like protein
MTIKLAGASSVVGGLTRAQIAVLASVGVVGMAGSGALVYHLVEVPKAPAAVMSPDEAKLVARSDEKRARAAATAEKLRQQDLGQGYQFDSQGNLVGATPEGTDLPQNKAFQETPEAARPAPTTAAIGRGVEREDVARRYDDGLDDGDDENVGRHHRTRGDDDEESSAPVDRTTLTASMLGYSTVPGATWASHRPERPSESSARKVGEDLARSREAHQTEAMDRVVGAMEDSTRLLAQQAGAPRSKEDGAVPPTPGRGGGSTSAAGYWGAPVPVAPGPSGSGENLYASEKPTPAERAPQAFSPGTVGDMRIGGGVGSDQVVRQGKFLDCAIINEIRADLVDSPVIAMVSRDFVSIDGKYVLVPAGSKLLGEAGRVQNLQQQRVYIKFDRVVFPDQRSAYFPVRKVPAVDEMGAVGVEGDVDRHFFLQFGAAVMLGVLDGVGALVQGPGSGANPTMRELIMARTSADFSTVIASVIQKYANVVPTVTISGGSKMKVFFSEDVRLSPYMATGDLTWVRERQ